MPVVTFPPPFDIQPSATNHFNRPFQALSKHVFIRADIALSALKTFLFSGLCKFTYYLLTLNGTKLY